MGGWSRVSLGGEGFLLREVQGVFFIHSMGSRDYRARENREELSELLGLSKIVRVRQVHSSVILDAQYVGEDEEGDGLFLSRQAVGTGIAVLTADCLPVLIVAPQHFLLLHVGWRGLKEGIVQEGLNRLNSLYSDIKNIKILFGPFIKQCCYQVRMDMVGKLRERLPPQVIEAGVVERDGKLFFSLGTAVTKLLELAGVKAIPEDPGFCTSCSGLFPSYRRGGEGVPRMINLAWRSI